MARTTAPIATVAMLAMSFMACAPERPSETLEPSERVGSGEGTAREALPVAVVNGEEVTVEQLERRIDGMASFARNRYASIERRRELLDSVVIFELLADQAERDGYADDPAVLHAMKEAMVEKLLLDAEREGAPLDAITNADLRARYAEQIDRYRRPEQRRAFVLQVRTEEFARELLAQIDQTQAESVGERILTFRRLSSKHSIDDAIAQKGGDVGFLPPPDEAQDHIEIARRVFELGERGEISAPYAHQGAWFLVMLGDRQPGATQSFDQVSGELRQQLHTERRKQARADFITRAREGATITINEENLASIERPEPDPGSFDPTQIAAPPSPTRDLRPASTTP